MMRFDLVTTASPEQVRRAFTDFSDRRLRTWHRTLDPTTYELRGLGADWAEAKERSPGSPTWVVARYDWSDPRVIRWVVTESSWGGGGEGFLEVTPEGSGSRVHAEWSSTNPQRQRLVLLLVHRAPVHLAVRRLWTSTLDRYALEDRQGRPDRD